MMRDAVPFNADDFRPVIGKHHSREWHRAKTGHFHDSNAVERAGHLLDPNVRNPAPWRRWSLGDYNRTSRDVSLSSP